MMSANEEPYMAELDYFDIAVKSPSLAELSTPGMRLLGELASGYGLLVVTACGEKTSADKVIETKGPYSVDDHMEFINSVVLSSQEPNYDLELLSDKLRAMGKDIQKALGQEKLVGWGPSSDARYNRLRKRLHPAWFDFEEKIGSATLQRTVQFSEEVGLPQAHNHKMSFDVTASTTVRLYPDTTMANMAAQQGTNDLELSIDGSFLRGARLALVRNRE